MIECQRWNGFQDHLIQSPHFAKEETEVQAGEAIIMLQSSQLPYLFLFAYSKVPFTTHGENIN